MKNKRKILLALLIAFAVTAFCMKFIPETGGEKTEEVIEQNSENLISDASSDSYDEVSSDCEEERITEEDKPAEKPEEPPIIESQDIGEEEKKDSNTCTISIKCDTILQNMDKLNPDKVSIIPCDGLILTETTVEFELGESVFDVLVKTVIDNGIHMEYSDNPVYESAYIEGISNLYEFDCGEMSGWMYKVNGEIPNIGCSLYAVQSSDIIEWVYTCSLGRDVR